MTFDRCQRCSIPWNTFTTPHADDPSRCGPCYRCDSDPELQAMLREWAVENAAQKRRDAEDEAREYGVPLHIALAVRGL